MKYVALAAVAVLLVVGAAYARSASVDGARIINSGSTNAPGYELAVWSDGRFALTQRGSTRQGRIDASVARSFLKDARAAKASGETVEPCMKSASFGSRTNVKYHGWISPDISCPATGRMGVLAEDVSSITELVRPGGGRPIGLPPNEPRRAPPNPTASPR